MDEPVSKTSPSDEEVHLLDYLIILAKHSRMIIFASAAVAVLTYLILFILPNKYKAVARLLPPQQNLTLSAQVLDSLGARVNPGGGGGQAGALGGAAASLLGLKSPGEIYVSMMTSEVVLDHIIDRFHLRKPLSARYIEDAREKLLKKWVKISLGRKDNIIVIEVTWRDRKLAAEMANAFVEELDQLIQNLSIQEAKGRLAFLEKELVQSSQNLTKAEEAMRLFSEKNSVLQLDTQTKGAIEYIARLRAEIDTREVSLQVLRQQATSFNYDMVRAETEIKGLKEKLSNAEVQLESCIGEVCLPTSKTPALSLEYLRLFREVKFQDGIYQLYSKLVELARLDLARDVAVVQVIAPAMPPEKRSNKGIIPTLLVGFIAFIMMIAVAFGRERWQKDKITEEDSNRIAIIITYLKPWRDYARKLFLIIKRK